jgi:alpha-glucosidase (family GH31 glycosyl hydrolase)
VDSYLPPSAEWYNFNTHLLEVRSGSVQDVLTDLQQAIWIRAGSIVPLLAHNNELSLLRALEHGISLDVFLKSDLTAEGTVVLDDGWSTKPDKSTFNFSFDSALKYNVTPDSIYVPKTSIVQVNFYGIVSKPQV